MADPIFAGETETGKLMARHDWAATSLGAPETWPQSLRTIVPIMLASRFAMRVMWGRDDMVLLYNDNYRPVLGTTKHPSAIGRPMRLSYAELWHVVGPLFQRVLDGESIALEDSLLPLDRQGFLEEAYFTLSYSPLAADDGSIAGVLGVVHETTDQVLAARRLRTLRELSGSALAATPGDAARDAIAALANNPADVPFALIYLADGDGRHARLADSIGIDEVHATPLVAFDESATWPLAEAARSGRSFIIVDVADRELRSSTWPYPVSRAVVAPLVRPGVAQPIAYLVAGVNPARALDETYSTFIELASEHIAVAISYSLAAEERSQLIARERAAREDAEASSRAKDEFLATVSHELRNPMSAVIGWARILRSGELPEAKRERALETIERNALNQAQLIEDLLDVSRIVSGKLRLELAPLSIEQVVEAAIESARPTLDAKQLRLKCVIDTTAVAMLGDAARIQQVVWNLLANATKFTPKGGAISITLTRVESMLELAISDTGKGIAPDVLPHVFERFKQADSSTTRTYGGLGLGLAISKSIVEMHGGAISAYSDGPDRGATFIVRLPVAPLRRSTPQHVTAAHPINRAGTARRRSSGFTSSSSMTMPMVATCSRWCSPTAVRA
jgi:signal transduction histidine kinase